MNNIKNICLWIYMICIILIGIICYNKIIHPYMLILISYTICVIPVMDLIFTMGIDNYFSNPIFTKPFDAFLFLKRHAFITLYLDIIIIIVVIVLASNSGHAIW